MGISYLLYPAFSSPPLPSMFRKLILAGEAFLQHERRCYYMADKSTLRKMKKQLVQDVLSTMHKAVETYFDGDNREDCEYASQTINFCKILLNHMVF